MKDSSLSVSDHHSKVAYLQMSYPGAVILKTQAFQVSFYLFALDVKRKTPVLKVNLGVIGFLWDISLRFTGWELMVNRKSFVQFSAH
eukprot:4633376-Amphidinium_carterae.1